MVLTNRMALIIVVATASRMVAAFTPQSLVTNIPLSRTRLHVSIERELVSTKEYEQIKGLEYGVKKLETLEEHQARTGYKYPKHVEVIEDFEPVVATMVDKILLETGDKSWQPSDYLPDLSKETWLEELTEVREMAATVPDDVLVVLIGDMVTEEALPTYQTLLNTFEGCDDPNGATDSAWARWSRGWTSEENRHGDLLNRYLYLGGRCDMRSIEVTIQHLITSGFDPGAEQDPYRGFLYTSFQERATKISHGNAGKLAKDYGETNLNRICSVIAGDEARHEKAYQTFVQEILDRDPDGIIETFADMMRRQIVMPAELMTDGNDEQLYENFSSVAQRLEVYTAIDYADIIEHLVKIWDLEHVEGLTSSAEKERDYVCNLPKRYRRLAERSMNRSKKLSDMEVPLQSFNWIHGRKC